MIRLNFLFCSVTVAFIAFTATMAWSTVQISDLRCEYLRSPLGMDALQPRLSWILKCPEVRGVRQSAFHLLVASTPEILLANKGDLWDSGRVASAQTNQISYEGKPLKSRTRCYWKVKIWDGHGRPSEWSAPSLWSMGLLESSDWRANWIGLSSTEHTATGLAVPIYLRHEFDSGKSIRRATVYATALGLYELRINGRRVGDHLLAPEWTNYFKRVQYQTYDVTSLLQKGRNAIGAILGNGWYSGAWQKWQPELKPIYGDRPYLRVQLEIERWDGSRQIVGSDGSWRATDQGPLRFSGIYEGETYDARMEMPGWDKSRFEAHSWKMADVGKPKVGLIVAQRNEPIHATQALKPTSVKQVKPGVYVFDLGQNIAGWCKVRLKEQPGTNLSLQFNEVLNPDGTVYMDNLHAGHLSTGDRQIDRYTCQGVPGEVFEPHFTYHGFRYVQISGLSKPPSLDSLTGVVFHSGMTQVGSFSCSNPLLNRLALNIQWSQRANMMGVPTDCCQRDERCGYTGDAQFFVPTAVYNFDIAAFFNKWLVDVCEDSQMPGGWFADHAPTFGPGDGWNVGWSDAGIICPYTIWKTYGDTRVIREHYPAMKRNLELLKATSPNLIHKKPIGNGDWLNLGGGASSEVIGTCYDAYDFRLVSEMAAAIGEKADAIAFASQSHAIAKAFADTFIDDQGEIKDSSQTAFALAFTMGLTPEPLRTKMSARFADSVKQFDWHLATGFIGTPRLLPGLHLAGRDNIAYRVLLQETYPSWIYPVKLGATTMWERWDGWRPEKGFQDSGMNSFNHYAFGSVGEYLYSVVGGISLTAPGYSSIKIQPVMRDGLAYARASYCSVHGMISSDWHRSANGTTLDVEIPANTSAEVYVPALKAQNVTESGRPISRSKDVKFIRMDGTNVLLRVGSGSYHFRSSMNQN